MVVILGYGVDMTKSIYEKGGSNVKERSMRFHGNRSIQIPQDRTPRTEGRDACGNVVNQKMVL
jgi:hypothetical protein